MKINKSYAVFGLGRYGQAVAKELISSGAEVIAVDINERIVDDLVGDFPICKCADVTDPDVIKQLGISNVDTVIIAIASGLEASVMATMLCKEAGVGQIVAKCSSEMHKAILEKVGADMVVLPETESGTRLAKNLLSSGFLDIADLSDDISIMELSVKPDWADKTLVELDLRKKYSINVIAISKENKVEILSDPETILDTNMKLIVIAKKDDINKMKKGGVQCN